MTSLEWPLGSRPRTSRCVAKVSDKDIRRNRATEIASQNMAQSVGVETKIDQSMDRLLWTIEMAESETDFEVVWELTSPTSSWTENRQQYSDPTASQQPHPSTSKQSCSMVPATWPSQTGTTISTSMCCDFLALSPGTYKAVLVH
jgi:hypothetical protein